MSAEELLKELGLDEELLEDVQEECDNADKAWAKVVSIGETQVGDASFFASIMTELGSSYDEEIGSQLLALEKGSLTAFKKWYVKWLFQEENLDEEDESDGAKEGDVAEGGNWSQVQWKVQPVAKPVEGQSWQCSRCRIINAWKDDKCLGCDDPAPHADKLEAASAPAAPGITTFATAAPASHPAGAISSAGFTFGGGGGISSGPAGAISSAGFTFGSGVPSGSVTSSGFTFSPST